MTTVGPLLAMVSLAVPPPIRAATGKPIKFVGTGEKLDMIEPFHPERMASRILGMGDMLTFIEKAEQQYDEKQAKKLEEKLRKNRLTLSDYLDQLEQLQKMGDLSQPHDHPYRLLRYTKADRERLKSCLRLVLRFLPCYL